MKLKKSRGLGKIIFYHWEGRCGVGPMRRTAAVETLIERTGFTGLSDAGS